MSELRDNTPENFEPVKGDTGNKQLDSLFKEIAAEPLLFSKEEVFEIIGATTVADATSTSINRTVVVGGAILLSALSGWLYYQFSNADNTQVTPVNNTVEVDAKANNASSANATEKTASYINAQEAISRNAEDQNANLEKATVNNTIAENANVNSAEENRFDKSSVALSSEKVASASSAAMKAENNKRKTIHLTSASTKKGTGKLTLAKTPDAKTGSMTLKKDNSASLLSRTKVTQRFYADGSATVAFEYNKEPAVITINPRGIEQLSINNKLIKSDEYYLYEEIASEAFRRAKIEPLSEPTHDSKVIGDIPGIMTRALVRRNLISADEKFDFVLTGANAFLNGKVLDEEQRLDLLQVYQNASGKPLPKEGRFSVKQ
jgi:hypothetical protein